MLCIDRTRHYPAQQAGKRIGALVLFGMVGMALGGWLGGLIFDLVGSYRIALLVGVGFNVMSLVLIGTLLLRQGRPLLITSLVRTG